MKDRLMVNENGNIVFTVTTVEFDLPEAFTLAYLKALDCLREDNEFSLIPDEFEVKHIDSKLSVSGYGRGTNKEYVYSFEIQSCRYR